MMSIHINNSNNNNKIPRSSSGSGCTSGGGGGGGGGGGQACAACKYQRKKCATDCVLAPYFPHDRQREFQNAHKLFGVSNITKIIKNLDPPDKHLAMRTIVFQSDARANDPVGGCYRIIIDLQRQIDLAQAELDLVFHQLALCRSAAPPPHQYHHHHHHHQLQQLIQPQPQQQQPSDHDILNSADCSSIITNDHNYHDQYMIQEQQQQQQHINNYEDHIGDVESWSSNMIEDHHQSSSSTTTTTTDLDLISSSAGLGLNVDNMKIQHNFIKEYHDIDELAEDQDHHIHPQIQAAAAACETAPLDQINFETIKQEQHQQQEQQQEQVLVDQRRFVPSTQLVMSS